MGHEFIKNQYFNWMCGLVCNEAHPKRAFYKDLLIHLHDTEFVYILDMDSNRAQDGVDFRYRFAYEFEYDRSIVDRSLNDKPCSVLEMMVALAHRCEEDIMEDPELGDRTGQWFWDMIVSLGLDDMDDDNFDQTYVDFVINRFLKREYRRNGEGGLFTIERCDCDLRDVEIWYQMNWYLNNV